MSKSQAKAADYKLQAMVPMSVVRKLRMLAAAKDGTTVPDLVREALTQYLASEAAHEKFGG